METKNLQEVLVSVGIYDPNSIAADAHAELVELQRLASVVEEFIETNDITSKETLYIMADYDNGELRSLAMNLCNIAGYKS